MLNDPPPDKQDKRRLHPLERQAEEYRKAEAEGRSPDQPPPKRQQVMLHIPVVKPYLTQVLIAVNSAIFVVMYFLLSPEQLNEVYAWGANNRIAVIEQGEYHRLLTAMFLHGGIAHIAFNMMALWYIGATVERFYGYIRYMLVYFLGGIAGSIASVIFNGPEVQSVGASGAVFAVVGAEIAFLYHHRKLLGQVAQSRLRSLLLIAGLNFAFGIASSFTAGPVSIDNWGHIGGFVGGLALAWIITPVFNLKRHPTQPGAFITEDINPLEGRFQPLMIYISVLLSALIAANLLLG